MRFSTRSVALLTALLWTTVIGTPVLPNAGVAIPNLSTVKAQIQAYYDSGTYAADIAAVIQDAKQALANLATTVPKPALVLDIDDTALSNWPFIANNGYSTLWTLQAQWQNQSQNPAIPATLDLFKMAREMNIPVFFITGRSESQRESTALNLQKTGFTDYQKLIMHPDTYTKASLAIFKTAARQQIESAGYTIIVNVGDQWSDLTGGHSQTTFKLPNPLYLTP